MMKYLLSLLLIFSMGFLQSDPKEVESICEVLPLNDEDALLALHNLKEFLNTEECLSFKKLAGGAYNTPILVSQSTDHDTIPMGILKHETNRSLAEKRMQALDAMIVKGFEHFPRILRGQSGEYLVDLGDESYSCIEYLEPDANQSISFEQLLRLTSQWHAYSKTISLGKAPYQRTLDWFCDSSLSISHLDPQLLEWNPAIFTTEAWETCVKCSHYFISSSFQEIYNDLPAQLIHGDIIPGNIIFSGEKPFFIDFETARTDVRLRDFAVFIGAFFLEQYLTLLEEGNLLNCIQAHYGELTKEEQKYFPLIPLLERCGALAWSLQVLKQSLLDQDPQTTQQLHDRVSRTITEINEMYNRVPHLKKMMQNGGQTSSL